VYSESDETAGEASFRGFTGQLFLTAGQAVGDRMGKAINPANSECCSISPAFFDERLGEGNLH
jgi:hypothetical protein